MRSRYVNELDGGKMSDPTREAVRRLALIDALFTSIHYETELLAVSLNADRVQLIAEWADKIIEHIDRMPRWLHEDDC